MVVAVVNIRVMRMRVLEWRVPVRMRVGLPAVPVAVVPMLMVGVMAMLMDMLCQ